MEDLLKCGDYAGLAVYCEQQELKVIGSHAKFGNSQFARPGRYLIEHHKLYGDLVSMSVDRYACHLAHTGTWRCYHSRCVRHADRSLPSSERTVRSVGVSPCSIKKKKKIECSIFMFGHLNRDHAKLLWQRIPKSIRQKNGEIGDLWEIGKKLWQREFSAVYPLALNATWPPHLVPIITDLVGKRRVGICVRACVCVCVCVCVNATSSYR